MPGRRRGAIAARANPPLSPPHDNFLFRLFVAGTTPRSTRAVLDIRKFCEEYLRGCYRLEVIDIYQFPALARDAQIVAVPTLVKLLPRPLRRLTGDLSSTERIFSGLDLRRPNGSLPWARSKRHAES